MSERNLQEEIKQQVNDKRKVEVNAHVIGSNKYIIQYIELAKSKNISKTTKNNWQTSKKLKTAQK